MKFFFPLLKNCIRASHALKTKIKIIFQVSWVMKLLALNDEECLNNVMVNLFGRCRLALFLLLNSIRFCNEIWCKETILTYIDNWIRLKELSEVPKNYKFLLFPYKTLKTTENSFQTTLNIENKNFYENPTY